MKDIPGYEGLYAVTEDGKVWSYPKPWRGQTHRKPISTGKFLKQGVHTGGYLILRLSGRDKVQTQFFVHRLVASLYIKNPQGKKEVNHKDANKKNNHYLNLEWATRRENADHAKLYKLYRPSPTRGSKHPDAKVNETDVLQIRKLREDGYTLSKLMELYPLSKSAMHAVCARKSWTHI